MSPHVQDSSGDGWGEVDESLWKMAAEGYDDWIADAFQDQYDVNWSVLQKHMSPSLRLLDVGCGPGSLSIRLSEHCHEVWGVDVTPEMIEIAERKSANITENVFFQQADACALPFDCHCFDTVLSVNALQTMDSPEQALMEMKRVLKPGGELLLITYCSGESSFDDNAALLDWVNTYGGQAMWHSFRLEQLSEMLHSLDFEVVDAQRIWDGPVVGFLRGRARSY